MTEIAHPSDGFRGLQAVAAATYYGVGGDSAMIHRVHLQWDSAFAGVFTCETTDFPELDAKLAGNPGDWIPECAFSLASVVGGVVASNAATPGTPASVTVVAANPGGASLNFTSNGARAMRVKVNCTVAGVIRIRSHGKF